MAKAQSEPRAYQLFTAEGKKTKFKKLVKAASAADVILFGELHNNPVAHWLQQELAHSVDFLDLGLEIFDTRQQKELDEFLAGRLKPQDFERIDGGLWPNFRTDYEPLLQYVKGKGTIVATNVPRKYARLVFKEGFGPLDTLPADEKALLPPLPVPYDASLPAYRAMLEMMPGGHGGKTFPMAQAIKDATMAWRIVQNRSDGRPFLHLNGSYHSDDYEGIGWYLKQYAPGLKVVTITTVEQQQTAAVKEETLGKADYIIVVPATMTKSY